MTRVLSFPRRAWSLPRRLCRALLVLTLAPLCLDACATTDASGSSATAPVDTARFVHACEALDAGNLDGAARDLLTLRQSYPERPEPRLLESLLALRRTRPELGWRDAFLQAWNGLGRPDFKDSPFLKEEVDTATTGLAPEEAWKRKLSDEQRFVLALAMNPAASSAPAIFQRFPPNAPPELLVAAAGYLERGKLPAPVLAESRAALRPRLTQLSAEHPESMVLRTLLLEGTDAKAPFTARELQELEAVSRLPDWRQTGFLSLYQYALGHLEAIGLGQPKQQAYMLAVDAVVSPVPLLLQHRAEASRGTLAPTDRQRLGEALWRIGSRLSEESTIVERFLGLSLMKTAATELGDDTRLLQAREMREKEGAAYAAFQSAAPHSWPVPSLRQEMLDASIRDEATFMHAFLAPKAHAP